MLLITTAPKSIAASTLLLEKVTRSLLPSVEHQRSLQLTISPTFSSLVFYYYLINTLLIKLNLCCKRRGFLNLSCTKTRGSSQISSKANARIPKKQSHHLKLQRSSPHTMGVARGRAAQRRALAQRLTILMFASVLSRFADRDREQKNTQKSSPTWQKERRREKESGV